MASELPYLPSYKNVQTLFQRIAAARQPDAFTHAFLGDALGLKGKNDRPLIPFLRVLGFLDSTNKPTASYPRLKNPMEAGKAIAAAVREAYEPLFSANENAARLSADSLRGLIAQVTGADSNTTAKILGTFNSLLRVADFCETSHVSADESKDLEQRPPLPDQTTKALRPEFQYNIQVHLPSNGTEETYLNIFNALRKPFR